MRACVLKDLLHHRRANPLQVRQAMRGQDASHAGFTTPLQERHDMAPLHSEGAELVNDDIARARLVPSPAVLLLRTSDPDTRTSTARPPNKKRRGQALPTQ